MNYLLFMIKERESRISNNCTKINEYQTKIDIIGKKLKQYMLERQQFDLKEWEDNVKTNDLLNKKLSKLRNEKIMIDIISRYIEKISDQPMVNNQLGEDLTTKIKKATKTYHLTKEKLQGNQTKLNLKKSLKELITSFNNDTIEENKIVLEVENMLDLLVNIFNCIKKYKEQTIIPTIKQKLKLQKETKIVGKIKIFNRFKKAKKVFLEESNQDENNKLIDIFKLNGLVNQIFNNNTYEQMIIIIKKNIERNYINEKQILNNLDIITKNMNKTNDNEDLLYKEAELLKIDINRLQSENNIYNLQINNMSEMLQEERETKNNIISFPMQKDLKKVRL